MFESLKKKYKYNTSESHHDFDPTRNYAQELIAITSNANRENESVFAKEMRRLQSAKLATYPARNKQRISDANVKYSLRQSNDDYYIMTVRFAMEDIMSGKLEFDCSERLKIVLSKTFVEKLIDYIQQSGEKNSAIYKRAHIDRKLYSKILSDTNYKPAKDTCISLCLALRLTLEETEDMLGRCGYIFSHSSTRDVALEYFFREGIYDIDIINQTLYIMNLQTL